MTTKRTRSRAFVIYISGTRRLDIDNLHAWAEDKAEQWILVQRVNDIEAYVRFQGQLAQSKVVPLLTNATIKPSTTSFRRMKEVYNSDRTILKIDSHESRTMVKTVNPTQAAIEAVINSNGKSGTVGWLSYTTLDERFQDIMRTLTAKTNLIVTNETPQEVYQFVRDEIIDRGRPLKAIVLIPNEKTTIDFDYLQFIDHLRTGYLLNSRSMHTQFKPLNILLVTRKYIKGVFGDNEPPLPVKEIYI